MDPRLHVAACNGDVGALQKLLQEDPLVLSKAIMSTSSDSPLHIAALLGHTDFAKLVMSRNPELSRDLNQQGYTPIHLASLKGHLQIVTELLNFDKELCFVKDCEGRTPLHCAAIKGRLEIITHLMCCCPESAMEVTAKGETLLHLVVNNGQSEVMVLLISSLREMNLLHRLIDCRDEDGNTALQLAIAKNHKQMTKMLSKETQNHEDEIITDHERNKQQTAVLIDMDKNNQNQMIKTVSIDQKHEITADHPSRGSNGAHDLTWKDKLLSLHNAIIILCSLLATCCFDAIINPPGGVWQTRPSNDVIHAENLTDVAAFFEVFLGTSTSLFKVKKYTLTGLLAPNKAMSMALEPFYFFLFLFFDATCFITSLWTIYLVTLAVCVRKKEGTLLVVIAVMLQIVISSAIFLYAVIIELTSNAGLVFVVIWAVISFIPSVLFLKEVHPYFMNIFCTPIFSRLASLRVQICNRYQKIILDSKMLLKQNVTQ